MGEPKLLKYRTSVVVNSNSRPLSDCFPKRVDLFRFDLIFQFLLNIHNN
ncbi:uncharacterized protein METZ01_LOCUS406613 [marine metagenome]|uniref:Uncharacterized protein n=1 Tax=marine metagenome TaxID=408172 RepID=A0A382W4T7_9ZZZZ